MQRETILIVALVAVAALVGSAAAQTTYYVDGSCGNDSWTGTDPNCVAPDGPKATIQAAITVAVNDDEIVVHPGTYVERIDLLGKAITLRSTDGPDVTILNDDTGGTVITCTSGEGPDTLIEGFMVASDGGGMYNNASSPTVTNCTFSWNWTYSRGAGMYNSTSSSPTLINCTFSDNFARDGGSGMCNDNSSPTLINCIFSRNSVDDDDGSGGGMYNNNNSSPTLINCAFSYNSVDVYDGRGGGMCNDNSSPTLTDCLFSGNSAEYGGGICNEASSSPTLTNCTFIDNSAYDGGAIHNYNTCTPTLTNCILWGGMPTHESQIYDGAGCTTTATYCCIQDGWPGTGNIQANPRIGLDLRLMDDSPCIDAGSNTAVPADAHDLDGDGNTSEPIPLDLLGSQRFFDDPATADTGVGTPPIVDMGACEYANLVPVGSADLDDDGDVDLDDFKLFQEQFTGPQP
jgi:predicted outer membrane repeat protein